MNNYECIKAVIFDWAGTVIDYGCFAPMQAILSTFANAGVPITHKEAREPMGLLKRDHITAISRMERVRQAWLARYGAEPVHEDVERLYAEFEATLMESLKQYTDPIPGAFEAVEQLRSAGLKIGSTTGYTKAMMDVIAPEAARKGYRPDFMVASDEVEAGRPHPYMILRNMEEFRLLSPKSIVKVGDTVSDIYEGKNAGMWTIAVTAGSSELGLSLEEAEAMEPAELQARKNATRRLFEQAGADYILDAIADLPNEMRALDRDVLAGRVK